MAVNVLFNLYSFFAVYFSAMYKYEAVFPLKNLKEYRKKSGLTQAQLAEKVKVTSNYIGMLEMGRNFPATDLIERIAKALNVEMYELFVETHSPTKELEKLRHDIMEEIKETITETVIQTVREAFEEERNRQKKQK